MIWFAPILRFLDQRGHDHQSNMSYSNMFTSCSHFSPIALTFFTKSSWLSAVLICPVNNFTITTNSVTAREQIELLFFFNVDAGFCVLWINDMLLPYMYDGLLTLVCILSLEIFPFPFSRWQILLQRKMSWLWPISLKTTSLRHCSCKWSGLHTEDPCTMTGRYFKSHVNLSQLHHPTDNAYQGLIT